jgi:flagellar protein FliO/FliZ
MPSTSLAPLLWFAVIIVLIPVALWLLKRTPLGGTAAAGTMRTVASLPIAPNQRLLTVEVGQGDDRRWLVLGVTPGSITALHTMAPQAEPPAAPALPGGASATPFAQMLGRLRQPGSPK